MPESFKITAGWIVETLARASKIDSILSNLTIRAFDKFLLSQILYKGIALKTYTEIHLAIFLKNIIVMLE